MNTYTDREIQNAKRDYSAMMAIGNAAGMKKALDKYERLMAVIRSRPTKKEGRFFKPESVRMVRPIPREEP